MMRAVTAVGRTLIGLVVDDGRFALAITVWIVAAACALPRLPLSAGWQGPLLFVGLAVILGVSCLRAIARHRAPSRRR